MKKKKRKKKNIGKNCYFNHSKIVKLSKEKVTFKKFKVLQKPSFGKLSQNYKKEKVWRNETRSVLAKHSQNYK